MIYSRSFFIYIYNEQYIMLSMIPCETPTKEPMELTVIGNFHHPRPYWDQAQDLPIISLTP